MGTAKKERKEGRKEEGKEGGSWIALQVALTLTYRSCTVTAPLLNPLSDTPHTSLRAPGIQVHPTGRHMLLLSVDLRAAR